MYRRLSLAPIIAVLACAPPGPRGGDLSSRELRVVATTGMVADIARNVGGARARVTALMGPGVDPHLYKASEGDVIRMSEADVVFYNGLHLEGKMTDVFHKMGDRVRAVAVAESIPDSLLLTPPQFEGAHDPHVWFDVRMWMYAAATVRDAYVALDPAHADVYEANAAAYLDTLLALDSYVRGRALSLPSEKRVLVTAHDAFNYFGRAYGFEVRGLLGVSTATEAGTADVSDLARFIAERRIPAVFVESSVPVKNIEAVQAAVRARGFQVSVGGELFSDALGTAGTPEGTYAGMVRHNIDTIVAALSRE